MDFSETVEAFVCSTLEKDSPSIPFEVVSNTLVQSSSSDGHEPDVDFFCYVNGIEGMFPQYTGQTNDPMNAMMDRRTTIDKIIGNNLAKFVRSSYIENIYSSHIKGVYVIAEIGSFRLGRPFLRFVQNDDDDDKDELDNEADDKVSFKISNEKILRDMNYILEILPSSYIPYEEFKSLLRLHFEGTNLALFTFGQKQRVSSLAMHLTDLASSDGKLEIALGYEWDNLEDFISTGYSPALAKYQYSNWFSNESTNTLIKDPSECFAKISNSYRICAYNTMQHFKKHMNPELKKNSTFEFDDSAKLRPYYESGMNNLRKLSDLVEYIEDSNFRFEVYFNIDCPDTFEAALNVVKQIPPWLKLVRVPKRRLQTYVGGVVQNLFEVFDIARQRQDFKWEYLFIYLYGQFLQLLMSVQKMTRPFLETNIGYGIPAECFDSDAGTPSHKLFEETCGPKLWTYLTNVFGQHNSSFEERLFFALHAFWQAPFAITPEQSKHFAVKVKRLFLIHADKCRAQADHPKSFIPPSDFMKYFQDKHAKNFIISNIISMILQFSARSDNCYLNICSLITDYRIFYYHNSCLYFVTSNSMHRAAFTLTIETIRTVLSLYEYIEIRKNLEPGCRTDNPFIEMQSLFETLTIEFGKYFNDFVVKQNLIVKNINGDPDFFLRLVFAKIPVDEFGTHDSELVNIVELFRNINDFFFFISCGVIMAYSPDCMTFALRHKRDGFYGSLLKTKTGHTWTLNKFFYVSGLFEASRSYSSDGVEIVLPVPKKVKCGAFLRKEDRKNLLRYVVTGIRRTTNDSNKKFEKFEKSAKRFAQNNVVFAEKMEHIVLKDNVPEVENNRSDENDISSIRKYYEFYLRRSGNMPATEIHSQNDFIENSGSSPEYPAPFETQPPNMQSPSTLPPNRAYLAQCETAATALETATAHQMPLHDGVSEQSEITNFDDSIPPPPANNETTSNINIFNNNINIDNNDEDEFIENIINSNQILLKHKSILLDGALSLKDFLPENENSTMKFLTGLMEIDETDASRIILIFKKQIKKQTKNI